MKNTVPAVGARASIAIGAEDRWGFSVDPTHLISFNSESLSASEDIIESEAIRGDRGRHQLIQGTLDVSGDITFEQAASGLGMLIRQALGDYIRLPRVDGGVHARVEETLGTEPLRVETDNADNVLILPLAKEHSGGFPDSGAFAIVDRGGVNGALRSQLANYTYTSYNPSTLSHVFDVDTETDPAFNGDVATVTVYPELGPDGNYIRPTFNDEGGLVEYGHRRRRAKYFKAENVNVTIDGVQQPGKKLYMDPADIDGTTPEIAAGDYIFGFACLTNGSTTSTNFSGDSGDIPELSKGAWIYEIDDDYDGVYTHHLERGRYLPEGLTVEVDRDAAVFLYTGVKADTLTITADTNAIVTGTIGLVARAEHAMAELVEDVLPGSDPQSRDYILIRNAEAFPNPAARTDMNEAVITIGERTNIRYSQKELAGPGDGIGYAAEDEVWKLTLVDKTEIVTFHPKGSNVDSRTPRRVADPVQGDNTPLTSFESVIFVNGTYEEVLSAEVSLTNNLNTDKYGLGSRFVLAVIEEVAEVSASLSMEFDDGKHYKRFMTGDFFFLELKCISEADDADINNTGIPAQMYVILPKCKFDGETPNVADRGFIEHDMPVTAVVDDEYGTTDLVIILVNGLINDVEDI